MDASITSTIEGVRELVGTKDAAPADLVTSLHMPANTARYTLEAPSTLADLPGSACAFIVADKADQALHTFTLGGTYLGSIDGGGQGATAFPGLISVAATSDGTVVVSDLYKSSFIVIFPTGQRAVLHLGTAAPQATFGSQIALDAHNTVYENWFGRDVPTISRTWVASTPLIRTFTLNGDFEKAIGHIVPRSGELFTAALNRGILRIQSDTAWFARRSDARILAYPTGVHTLEPARTINVPIFYRMRPPAEFVSTNEKIRNVRVENHIVAFSTTPRGDFVVAVATKYPRNDEEIFRPTTLIAVVSRTGELRQLLDPHGQVIDVLGKQNVIVAIVARSQRVSVDVFRLRNTLSPSGDSTHCRHNQ